MSQVSAIQAKSHQVAAAMGLGKIQVQSVELLYSEGLRDFTEAFMKTYESFDESSLALSELAHKAPSDGSYNKVDYKITFSDGVTYKGRICLKYHDVGYTNTVQRSMGSFVDFHAGRYCPDHMDSFSYRRFLDRFGTETQNEYAKFRDTYEF
jgi:hypothetical protein